MSQLISLPTALSLGISYISHHCSFYQFCTCNCYSPEKIAHKISCIFLSIGICLNETGPIITKTLQNCMCSQAFRCFLLFRWSLANKLVSLISGHIWRYFLQELTQSRMWLLCACVYKKNM